MQQIRTEGKHRADMTLTNGLYQLYSKEREGTKYHVTKEEYRKICVLFFKKVMYNMLYRSASLVLPYKLGELKVIKRKTKRSNNSSHHSAIDFKKTNELGKVVRYDKGLDGYNYRFKWEKRYAKVINLSKYKFVACRARKRELAKLINEGYDYFEE